MLQRSTVVVWWRRAPTPLRLPTPLAAQACASLECDLISLDLSRRLPYRFKPALVKAALARGLHFEVGLRQGVAGAGCAASRGWREARCSERLSRSARARLTHHPLGAATWPQICFAPALREAGARRQLFANALALACETRGRGLVVSSGARRSAGGGSGAGMPLSARVASMAAPCSTRVGRLPQLASSLSSLLPCSYMELRGPLDVVNMATLFGLTPQQVS